MKGLRTIGLAVAGLALGAVFGFAAVFGVVMLLPRGNFGEFQLNRSSRTDRVALNVGQ